MDGKEAVRVCTAFRAIGKGMCRYFLLGKCRDESKCLFSHVVTLAMLSPGARAQMEAVLASKPKKAKSLALTVVPQQQAQQHAETSNKHAETSNKELVLLERKISELELERKFELLAKQSRAELKQAKREFEQRLQLEAMRNDNNRKSEKLKSSMKREKDKSRNRAEVAEAHAKAAAAQSQAAAAAAAKPATVVVGSYPYLFGYCMHGRTPRACSVYGCVHY